MGPTPEKKRIVIDCWRREQFLCFLPQFEGYKYEDLMQLVEIPSHVLEKKSFRKMLEFIALRGDNFHEFYLKLKAINTDVVCLMHLKLLAK